MGPTMPFGKHKGKPIHEIPKNYLIWLTDNVDMHPWLAKAVQAALGNEGIPEEDEEAKVHRIVKPWSPSEGEPANW